MKKMIALVMVAAMAVAMMAGCAGAGTQDANTIKIGMTGPLTGGAAVYGTAVEAGMMIAVEVINAKAGENGLKIEFRSIDDEHDGEKAVNGYNSLKDWGMQIFAGAVTTGPSLAVAAEAKNDQIFMMTPSASAAEVAETGDNVFQMCFTDPNQGANAAQLIKDKNMGTKIGIIYDSSDEYSSGIFDGFKAKAAELGLNIVQTSAFTDANKDNLNTQVQQCKDAGCDLVFLPFYAQEASMVLTYANTIDYNPVFFGCDGMDGILTIEGFDAALAENLVLMTPFSADNQDDATKAFVAKYKEMMKGQVPNQFAADGYDVIYAIYNACVATGVNGNTSANEACAKLCEYFKTATYNGLTGANLTWDAAGMVSKNPEAIVVKDGKYTPLG